jgi:hypothetical protein
MEGNIRFERIQLYHQLDGLATRRDTITPIAHSGRSENRTLEPVTARRVQTAVLNLPDTAHISLSLQSVEIVLAKLLLAQFGPERTFFLFELRLYVILGLQWPHLPH